LAAIKHAAIDLDTLNIGHLPGGASDEIMFRNLASVWANYRTVGLERLLLAEAVESHAVLDRIREAIPEAEITVCRLIVSAATAEERVRTREPGMFQEKFVARAGELAEILNGAGLEDFSIHNDSASVTNVAHEVLTRAGWL
jgi:adenylylsulfate kinase